MSRVPRMLDPVLHALRRDGFVDAATRLVQDRGFDRVSIQDVLEAADASKGAFYHYFGSKQELLEAVVERMVEQGVAVIRPVVDDPGLPATRKLERMYAVGAGWKAEHRDLIVRTMELWASDANAELRDRVQGASHDRLVPLLALIIRQGVGEATFRVDDPEATAEVLAGLGLGLQTRAVQLFMDRRAGRVPFQAVERYTTAVTTAMERILGLAPGSVRLVDEVTLQLWFGSTAPGAGEE